MENRFWEDTTITFAKLIVTLRKIIIIIIIIIIF